MFENEVVKILKNVGVVNIHLETPPQEDFGDLSFPCFELAKEQKRNPNEIANKIASRIKVPSNSLVSKVEAKGAYVNFFYNYSKFSQNVLKGILRKENYGKGNQKQKIMIEFAHPNTHKLFHIGHLRNITTGESIARILEFNGTKVIRTNYQGDVGLHIAKCLWGIKKLGLKKLSSLDKKIKFLGKAYTTGSKAYEEDGNVKNEIIQINKRLYEKEPKIMMLWEKTRKWSLEYFDKIYKRVYTKFDRFYFESEVAEPGIKISKDALKKGILKKSEGAVIFDGEPYGLDKRVFINNLGFPTYEAKELGLAQLEFSEFGKIDKAIHVVGPEQSSFFKVTFKAEELLNPQRFKDKQIHLAYGWVRLREGKMSSRLGNVVEGEFLLDELKKNILEKYFKRQDYSQKEKLKIAEAIAVGAAKYYFLKVDIPSEISFDINEAISIEGNTGPYIQYAYTRCSGILKKAKKWKNAFIKPLNDEEKRLVKLLSNFPKIAQQAAKDLKPNYICNYSYDLATAFNNFYEKHRVINAADDLKNFRLNLVKATQIVLGKCLDLMGMYAVEKM